MPVLFKLKHSSTQCSLKHRILCTFAFSGAIHLCLSRRILLLCAARQVHVLVILPSREACSSRVLVCPEDLLWLPSNYISCSSAYACSQNGQNTLQSTAGSSCHSKTAPATKMSHKDEQLSDDCMLLIFPLLPDVYVLSKTQQDSHKTSFKIRHIVFDVCQPCNAAVMPLHRSNELTLTCPTAGDCPRVNCRV